MVCKYWERLSKVCVYVCVRARACVYLDSHRFKRPIFNGASSVRVSLKTIKSWCHVGEGEAQFIYSN